MRRRSAVAEVLSVPLKQGWRWLHLALHHGHAEVWLRNRAGALVGVVHIGGTSTHAQVCGFSVHSQNLSGGPYTPDHKARQLAEHWRALGGAR